MTIIYKSPPFYSINYWAWDVMIMLTLALVFAMPSWMLHSPRTDQTLMLLLGFNIGAVLDVLGRTLPEWGLILTTIPLFAYLVVG